MNTIPKGSQILKPEDYAEPRCLLCDEPYGSEPAVRSIPQQRIIQKMDEYMSRRDYAGAERHLKYWLEEARLGRDGRGELLLRNELVGHYRKVGNREAAFENMDAALLLLEELDFAKTRSGGTTYVNCATACSAFGEQEKAMALFEKAKEVYEADPQTRPDLLGGLYNNMALCCAALRRFEEAGQYYDKALQIMGQVPGGELEQAITYLNMADAQAAHYGMEESEKQICEFLDTAYDLLQNTSAPRDGYYAFVCEKCAPTFSYYGYFLAAQELTERAEAIYRKYETNSEPKSSAIALARMAE